MTYQEILIPSALTQVFDKEARMRAKLRRLEATISYLANMSVCYEIIERRCLRMSLEEVEELEDHYHNELEDLKMALEKFIQKVTTVTQKTIATANVNDKKAIEGYAERRIRQLRNRD